MGAIVNRELRQRVRPVNGLTVHHQVVRQDIKHAAKVVQNFDSRWGMWTEAAAEKKDEEKMVGAVAMSEILWWGATEGAGVSVSVGYLSKFEGLTLPFFIY